jgi:hypothetical protein
VCFYVSSNLGAVRAPLDLSTSNNEVVKGKSELLLTPMIIMAKSGLQSNKKVETRYALHPLAVSSSKIMGSRYYIILKS